MKYIKTFEDNTYQPGDIVIVNYTVWNVTKQPVKTKIPILVYITYKYDFHIYGAYILPRKIDDDQEIKIHDDDIIEKVSPEEAKMYLNTLKYNI